MKISSLFLFLFLLNSIYGYSFNTCNINNELKKFIMEYEKENDSDIVVRIVGIDNKFIYPVFNADLCQLPYGIYNFQSNVSNSHKYLFLYNKNGVEIIKDYKIENALKCVLEYMSESNYTIYEKKKILEDIIGRTFLYSPNLKNSED